MTYPAHFLRGLRKRDWIVEGDGVSLEAFLPDKHTGAGRGDGLWETSIDWEDGEQVLEALLARRSQSEFGVARAPTAQVDWIRGLPTATEDELSYERRSIAGNPNHGNLLFHPARKFRHRALANAIALAAVRIPRSG